MGKKSSTVMRVCTILIVITHLPQVLYRMGTEFGDSVTPKMDYICIFLLHIFSPCLYHRLSLRKLVNNHKNLGVLCNSIVFKPYGMFVALYQRRISPGHVSKEPYV